MVDKEVIQQILGSLIKCPRLLNEVDKYNLTLTDFPSRFEKYIFSAIHGLYFSGAENIQIIDIENYLKTNPTAKATFEANQGIEYLQDIEEFSNVENFQYYYDKLKKINLLNDLKKDGFDISDYYSEDLTSDKAIEVNERFEDISSKDIIAGYKTKLLKLENEYSTPEEVQTWRAADEIEELIENFGSIEEIGLPIQGEIFTQVINGAEKGALTIRSAPSGSFKTRMAVADACYLAYPIRFNDNNYRWENTGNNEKVLFIITEQKKEQLLKMILAYISGINESKFKFGDFSNEEKNRINNAVKIMKEYQDNFLIIRMPNPTISLVKSLIREKCILNEIEYVFFDYIFINPSLINEFQGVRLRNDEILLMFTTALKDLAIELNISVFTSTQVNANVDNNKEIRNESSIAGSRSIINKADNGCIMSRPTKEELEALQNVTIIETPNIVTDVYKVRSGQWSQVRIWSYFNGGTMRKKDLFITDSRLNIIEDFFSEPQIQIENWEKDNSNIEDFLKQLNMLS